VADYNIKVVRSPQLLGRHVFDGGVYVSNDGYLN
jgi:hypothetical protein